VRENVLAGPLYVLGQSRDEADKDARRLLERVGLADKLDAYPRQLSGGQQQRVAIARALINGPALLLADEPTGNLDSHTSVEIMGVLQALNEQGLTIVLVTHDPNIAQYAMRQVTFLDGRIVRDEPVQARRSAVEEWTALVNQPAIASAAVIKEETP